MDDDNDGNNGDRNAPLDDEGGLRRNQVLIFGVILLGILAICLAVSMPSDLEFHDTELPTAAVAMNHHHEVNGRSSLSNADTSGKRNQTNSTTRKKTLRNSEVSVEVKLLRDMAIQRKIQEYDNSNSIQSDSKSYLKENEEAPLTKEEQENVKVNSIVETFMRSEDFEDFLIDMEIHDAVRKLREEKGYKNRPNTLFDELFKRAEKEFIGDDEEELRLIRRVGEELEKKARETINERRKLQGQDLTEEPKKLLLADELLKLDFSGSGYSDDYSGNPPKDTSEGDEGDIVEIRKIEL